MDKGYQLQFTKKTCIIKDRDGKMIRMGTRSRYNVIQMNPIEITFLKDKLHNSWLWHRIFCHINFDNIVKFS